MPHAGREQGGGGVWAETTPGSSFLSWPEGAGGEEGHGERGGLEEGRRTQAEGFGEEAGAPARSSPHSTPGAQRPPGAPGASRLGAQRWPGGGARPSAALRGSGDPHPGGVSPGRPHLSRRSPHPAGTLPQVLAGRAGRRTAADLGTGWGGGGAKWRRTTSPGDPRRSQTLPGCPWFRKLTGVRVSLGDLRGFLSPLGFLGQNAMDGDQTVVPRGMPQGLGSDPE